MARRPYHTGPRSDHFDGTRFFMAGEPADKSRLDLFKFLARTPRATWPTRCANPASTPVAGTVSGPALRVTSLGHASHLIQTRGVNILVDPVWSRRASPFRFAGPKRVRDPGLPLGDLPKLDAILITHNHYDTSTSRRWTPCGTRTRAGSSLPSATTRSFAGIIPPWPSRSMTGTTASR